ncbi:MAG: hypothetical protein K2G01_03350, partial [Paramuribaculum sp.]|nr:hypothetical protein [Paramuribaculum sp.]
MSGFPNISSKRLFPLIALAFALTAAGADSSPAYNYLNIPSSAHIYGLGGINISTVDDDINAVDQNPA